MQRAPRPPVLPPPFSALDVRPTRPPVTTTTTGFVTGMMVRPQGGFGDRVAARTTPAMAGAAAAAAATEREGIETVSVTNVVSAPAINKIGLLFNSLNKTVTGALNSIITGAPVAPGGAQTQPMSTALSPLPAWRVPQRPADAFPDHVQLQRFQPPPPPMQQPLQQPVVRTISYESPQQYSQQHVPSSNYWPDFNAQPSYRPFYQQVPQVDHAPAQQTSADWYRHSTQAAVASTMAYGTTQVTGEQRLLVTAPTITPTSSVITSEPHPSAFSRVDVVPSGREWQSLPDMDQRLGGPGPPSPVYSNASSTCFIPPTDWSSTRFGSTGAPISPPIRISGT